MCLGVSFQVTHLWHDEVIRKIDDHKDYEKLQGCFYRGRVRGDERSVVSVSLCGGMVSMSRIIILQSPHRTRAHICRNECNDMIHITIENQFSRQKPCARVWRLPGMPRNSRNDIRFNSFFSFRLFIQFVVSV